MSYTFIGNTNENEDIYETFITPIYPNYYYPQPTDVITQSIEVEDNKITGKLVLNEVTYTKSKATGNTDNLIVTDQTLISSLNLLVSFAIPITRPTSISINGTHYEMKSYLLINNSKYYYLLSS